MNRKSLCLFLLLAIQLLPANQSSSVHVAQSYHFVPNKGVELMLPWGATSCTLQVIKIDNTCRIIGALHCRDGGATETKMLLEDKSLQDLKLASSSKALDLAEYLWPQENPLLKTYCDNLAPLRTFDLNTYTDSSQPSLRALGFIERIKQSEFSLGENWNMAIAGSKLTHVNLGDSDRIDIEGLQIFPGMSGGIVETNNLEAVGMITEYIYFQDRSLVVPYSSIVEFLKKKKVIRLNDLMVSSRLSGLGKASDNLLRDVGENEHGKGGDNERGRGGENEHGKGGENEHGKGGNGPYRYAEKRIVPAYVLEQSAEPLEGITNPKNADQRILAINGLQIDGRDDYLHAQSSIPISHQEVLSRPQNGFLSPKLMEGLAERLSETYHTLYTPQGVSHLIYTPDLGHPMGWRLSYNLKLPFDIDIQKNKIRLMTAHHMLMQRGNAVQGFFNDDLIPKGMHAETLDLALAYSKDRTQVTLSGAKLVENSVKGSYAQKLVFSCANKNYLKLICRSTQGLGSNLSFSKSRLRDGEIKFRYLYFEVVNNPNNTQSYYLHYYYGTLHPSRDRKRMLERFDDYFERPASILKRVK